MTEQRKNAVYLFIFRVMHLLPVPRSGYVTSVQYSDVQFQKGVKTVNDMCYSVLKAV